MLHKYDPAAIATYDEAVRDFGTASWGWYCRLARDTGSLCWSTANLDINTLPAVLYLYL